MMRPTAPPSDANREARRGVVAMIACCLIWGLSPLYYKLLVHVPPLDVLSHRALWSLGFFGLVLILQRRLQLVGGVLGDRRQVGWTAAAGALISVNWLLFIWAIQVDRVTETSFGYYIFPLVAVLFGAMLFSERLGRVRWASVGLAALAVVVLGVGLGTLPWVSLVLAVTFGGYGVLKKKVVAGPVVSVTAEIALLAPLALLWLVALAPQGAPLDAPTISLLALSGPLTAGPLILFSYASKRIALSTVGVLQYINPTLQFLVAALILLEPVTVWHLVAFPMIWVALTLYSAEGWRQERAARRRAEVM